MSQIVVARNAHGIILAAENWAVQLDEGGREISLPVNRLLPLTSHSALLTVGAPEGIEMGNALKHFIEGEKLTDVEQLYGVALPFLSTEYERFMRKKCELLPIARSTRSPSSLLERRREAKEICFTSTSSGQRRNFPSLMETKSRSPSRFREGWAWSFS